MRKPPIAAAPAAACIARVPAGTHLIDRDRRGSRAHPRRRHRFYGPEIAAPAALRAFQKSEIEKWWPIIKAANLRAN